LAAVLIPLLTPRATGDHITLALLAELQEPRAVAQLQLLFQRQLGDQRLQGGRREPGYIAQFGCGHGLQVDPAAHAAIKDEGRFGDPKATPQGMQEPLERLRVVPVAPQDRNVQGQALGVGRYRQDDLGPIAPVIPAVAVSGQVLRPLAFEIDAG